MDVDGARIAVGAVAPDRAQELLAVEQASGIGHQRIEKLELGEREAHRLAVHRHLALRAIERDRPDDEHLVPHRSRAGPPEHGADPASQLGQAERLGDIVIGPRLEPEHRVRLRVERGQHDDRDHVAPAPQCAADLVAVGAGPEGHVEQDDVEVIRARAIDRGAPVGDRKHAMALARKRSREHLA